MTKKIKLKEGDVFAVPLTAGGYAIGLGAKKNKNIALGYFFNKIYPEAPESVDESLLNKDNVMLIAKFSCLGIQKGEWPLLNSIFKFNPLEWPIPVFKTQSSHTGEYLAVVYDDTLLYDTRHSIPENEAKKLYDDGLAGYGFLEKKLSKLLQTTS